MTKNQAEHGGGSIGFITTVGIIVLLIGFLIFAGRISTAGNAVESAAAAAARDATLARSDTTAFTNANEAAKRVLSQQGINCAGLRIDIDTSGFRAPLGQYGQVGVTITCTADYSSIAIPGIPGSKTFTSTASSPVDQYRER